MNLPNKLTVLRILLIPVFIVFAALPPSAVNCLLAMAVFSIASYTDYLDGHIARKQGLTTDFGKFADPLADKILTTTALLYMMMDGVCHPVVLVIIVTREFAVSGVRMVAAGAPGGGKVIAANFWGKLKTVVQMVCVIAYYFLAGVAYVFSSNMMLAVVQTTIWWLCWAVAGITAVSGFQYIWGNKEYIITAK